LDLYEIVTLREEHRLRVFDNRVLRRIFGPNRDDMSGGWRKPHNEELDNLFSSPNITRIIDSRSMRLAGHIARMGAMRNTYKVFIGNLKGRDHSEDRGIDVRKILKWILKP
jgi:hypothetical protein